MNKMLVACRNEIQDLKKNLRQTKRKLAAASQGARRGIGERRRRRDEMKGEMRERREEKGILS